MRIPRNWAGALPLWMAILALFFGPPSPLHAAAKSGSLIEQGTRSWEAGLLNDAAQQWEKAYQSAQTTLDHAEIQRAGLLWAQSLQALGRYRPAARILEDLTAQAASISSSSNFFNAALLRARLAAAYILTRDLDKAETLLGESLAEARRQEASPLLAPLLNDSGNLLAIRGKVAEAMKAYQESAAMAESAGQHVLAAEALANAASLSVGTQDFTTTSQLLQRSLLRIQSYPPSYARGMLHTKLGQIQLELGRRSPPHRNEALKAARESFQHALDLAEARGMELLKTHALGNMARLYEEDGQTEAALQLARRAVFSAQQAQSPEALYQWEWIIARTLKRQGEFIQALATYRNAAQSLQSVRHDLSLGQGNLISQQSFRDGQGTVYVELTDLLLKQATQSTEPSQEQALLTEARDTIEMLKSVELESYLCDECADLQRSKTRSIESVDRNTAVLYVIPLPDRTELLVGLQSGLRRLSVPVPAVQLQDQVREFRHALETRTSYEYLDPARQLYDWLIRPVRPLFASNAVHTVVIVPDGAMRTIPFAALHDGSRFLIEDLAVAVVPGLSLVEPRPMEQPQTRLLLSGLSKSVQGFAPLDHVPGELQNIQNAFTGDKLLNEGFTSSQLQTRFAQDQYTVVHIASHGKFDRDVRNTFILTYDGRLNLDQLEALIRPSQYRGRPVELLVLSACQTAAGDDRAALGLAGIAVKAGARSALATLWFVNDQSTSALVSGLYDQLKGNPRLSKAQALQAAQISMLHDRRYFHPCYWSPYLLIGNWL